MKSSPALLLAAILALLPHGGRAADVIKANNTDTLNLGTSWVGGTAPGAADVAVWDNTVAGANSTNLGGATSWQGIRIANPGGLVTINDTAATTLTLGSAGIDLSAANQNLTFGANAGLVVSAAQTWNIARGRTLSLGRATTGSGNLNLTSTGSTGVAVVNWATSTAFGGQITVGGNVQIGASASGSWLGTQPVNLNGGEVWLLPNASVGWNNAFVVTAGTTTSAIVCNATSTGAVRSIAMNGVISGGGSGSILTFRNQGFMPMVEGGIPATGSKGFILTQNNTFTGTIRVVDASNNVNYGSFLRLGAGTTSTDGRNYGNGGNLGMLPAGTAIELVNPRSVFLAMRNDTHTLANPISGAGQVWIGHSTPTNTSTNNQVVTISGANTYSGPTRLHAGTTRIGSASAFGSAGAVTMTNSATLDLNGSDFSLGSLAGASTTAVVQLGSNTLTVGTDNTSTTFDGGFAGTGNVIKTGSGTLTLGGPSVFTGSFTVSAGTLSMRTTGVLATPLVVAAGATVTGGGTSTGPLNTQAGARVSVPGGGDSTTAPKFEGIAFGGTTELVFQNPPVDGNTYNVVGYGTGTVTNPANLTSKVRGTFADDAFTGFLTFTAQLATRTWNTGDGVWNDEATLTHWLEGDQVYRQQDHVVFPDTTTDKTITLGSLLTPSSMAINHTANTYTFSGAGSLGGGFPLSKSGAGTLLLPNPSTRTGPSNLAGGTIRIGDNSALGTGAITLDGATLASDSATARSLVSSLVLAGDSSLGETMPGTGDLAFAGGLDLNGETNTLTVSNATTVIAGTISNGGLVKAGPGTLVASGTSSFTDGLDIQAGGFTLSGTGSLPDACAIDIATGATFTFARSASDTAFANSLSGSGTLLKTTALPDEIGLSGTNSFSGLIDIQQGKIGLVTSTSEDGEPSLFVAAGAFFSIGVGFEGGTATMGNLGGGGTIDTAFGGVPSTRTLQARQTIDGDFSGVLSSANNNRVLAFTKTGPAALTLSGASTYDGPTTINQGALSVTGSLGNTAVTVQTGATLGGNGNIGGNVTIQSGATHRLAVAATAGTQVTRSIGGALTLDAGNILTLTAAVAPANGTYILATAAGGITGSPGTINLAPEITGTVSISGNNLILTVGGANDYDDWAGPSGFNLSQGPTGDDDNDGLTNFEEYAFGLNPVNPASVNPLTAPDKTAGTFTYTRRKLSLTGLNYTYKSSTTLAGWTAFTPPVADVSNNGDPVETITVTIPPALLGEDSLFLRVEAVQP